MWYLLRLLQLSETNLSISALIFPCETWAVCCSGIVILTAPVLRMPGERRQS